MMGQRLSPSRLFTTVLSSKSESTDFLLFFIKPIKPSLVNRPAVAFVPFSSLPHVFKALQVPQQPAAAIILPQYDLHNGAAIILPQDDLHNGGATMGEGGWPRVLCASDGFPEAAIPAEVPGADRWSRLSGVALQALFSQVSWSTGYGGSGRVLPGSLGSDLWLEHRAGRVETQHRVVPASALQGPLGFC